MTLLEILPKSWVLTNCARICNISYIIWKLQSPSVTEVFPNSLEELLRLFVYLWLVGRTLLVLLTHIIGSDCVFLRDLGQKVLLTIERLVVAWGDVAAALFHFSGFALLDLVILHLELELTAGGGSLQVGVLQNSWLNRASCPRIDRISRVVKWLRDDVWRVLYFHALFAAQNLLVGDALARKGNLHRGDATWLDTHCLAPLTVIFCVGFEGQHLLLEFPHFLLTSIFVMVR